MSSIAQANQLKQLQATVDELAYALVAIRKGFNDAQTPEQIAVQIARMNERITALENRPKPGRPPKNG